MSETSLTNEPSYWYLDTITGLLQEIAGLDSALFLVQEFPHLIVFEAYISNTRPTRTFWRNVDVCYLTKS
jgi:hypothetical protein